jgi:hypothetical protein
MTENAARFVQAFNQLEQHLRRVTGRDASCRFHDLVKAASDISASVLRHKDELFQFQRLRNAIVHEQGTASIYIADPRETACLRIEELRDRILCPKTLRSISPYAPLRIFNDDDLLPGALAYLKANGFSQVITLTDGGYTILSTEGIAHWLESKENMVMLSEISLGAVVRREPPDTCKYLKADDTVDRAFQVFTTDLGKRVFSVLVTETGQRTEKPITIFTPWDFVAGKLR